MHPGRIADHNILYTEPEGFDRVALGIPWPIYARRIRVHDKFINRSAWFPTIQEIQAMGCGAPVILSVVGEVMNATNIIVGQPADNVGTMPKATHVYRSLLGSRVVTVVLDSPPTDDDLALIKQHLSGATK